MLNLTRIYSALLDFIGMNEVQRRNSLRGVFNRDIQENENLKLFEKIIRPMKIDGQASFDTVFQHLTTRRVEIEENGQTFKRSVFDPLRSERLHWVKHHLDRGLHEEIEIFSVEERDKERREDVIRTYIYNTNQQYIIVLEPQNSGEDYYLLSAYPLTLPGAVKGMQKKMKKRLADIL